MVFIVSTRSHIRLVSFTATGLFDISYGKEGDSMLV